MDSATSPEPPSSDRSKALHILRQGRDVASHLKTIFDTQPHLTPQDYSSMVDQILNSFSGSIAFLTRISHDPDQVSQFPVGSPESGESVRSSVTLKEKRGCYKRRKTGHSWSKTSADLVDDGYQWRKYGQKSILHAKFPRSYFRCTHKFDQLCPAAKQVQRISDDPPVYRTTYYAHHTCNNLLRPSQVFIDATDPSDSSNLISFAAASAAENSPCKQESSPLLRSSATVKTECSSKNDGDDDDDGRFSRQNDVLPLSSEYFLSIELSHAFDHGDMISSCTPTTNSIHDDLDDITKLIECGVFDDYEV